MSKRRNYTMSLKTNYAHVIEHLENNYRPVDDGLEHDTGCRFAYICHAMDDTEGLHYHFFIEFDNPRYRSAVAKEFDIPENMLRDVVSRQGILSYLTHNTKAAKAAGKHVYSEDDVESNFDWKNATENRFDVVEMAKDYRKVRNGTMSMEEFIMSHNICFTTYIDRK